MKKTIIKMSLVLSMLSGVSLTANVNYHNYDLLKAIKKDNKELGLYATKEEVIKIIQSNSKNELVLDIRPIKEYQGGHIVGSHRITPDNIIKSLDKIISKHNIKDLKKIILVCRTGTRATFYRLGLDTYFKNVWENVVVKQYGLTDWVGSCRGVKIETTQKDNDLYKKGINLKQTTDGLYYSDKCKNEEFLEI